MPNTALLSASPSPTSPVHQRLFAPLLAMYPQSQSQYVCREIPDLEFLQMGVLRLLSPSKSGRDFLQLYGDCSGSDIEVSLYFSALESGRRLKNLQSINDLVARQVRRTLPNPLNGIPELDDFDISSGDGHYHAAACHDKPVERSDGTMSKLPVGHFFLMDMRSHALEHLDQAETGGGRKAEHDMRAVKRVGAKALRNGAKKGRRVIIVWDRAIVDTAFWKSAKNSYGVYFLTLEKDGMKLDEATPKEVDWDDHRNAGIIDDEVGFSKTKKCKMRRIHYVDPSTGKGYTYLTTEMTLPPGVLVLLYKQRWDIEKVFDELKTKLEEKKAWGSSREAKSIQAVFECLTHNLMLLLQHELETKEEVVNEKEIDRRMERKAQVEEDSEPNGGATFVATALQRITQRTLKFIRWLRNHVYIAVPWSHAVDRLRKAYLM